MLQHSRQIPASIIMSGDRQDMTRPDHRLRSTVSSGTAAPGPPRQQNTMHDVHGTGSYPECAVFQRALAEPRVHVAQEETVIGLVDAVRQRWRRRLAQTVGLAGLPAAGDDCDRTGCQGTQASALVTSG
jgi:hypothetical protein